MISLIMESGFAKGLVWAVLAIVGVLGYGALQRRLGGKAVQRETALQAEKRIAKLERKRGEKDDDIQNDTGLADRARAAGLVRDAAKQ